MEFFKLKLKDNDLAGVLVSLIESVKKVSTAIRSAGSKSSGVAGTSNASGEEQLKLDVLSDKIVQEELRKNPNIGLIASEELEDEVVLGDGEYAVAYDPLDGSSLVDVNLAVGSIFGIYKLSGNVGGSKGNSGSGSGDSSESSGGGKKSFVGMKGDDQVAAVIAVYGPKTTVIMATKDEDGVSEFTLGADGEFYLSRENLKVSEGKMFAPGNLRACKDNPKYLELANYWMKEEYTLRYSGGMVPDVAQILLKGKGIFSYPSCAKYPNGKLRLLFECAPMAMIMEKAGGAASAGVVSGDVMMSGVGDVAEDATVCEKGGILNTDDGFGVARILDLKVESVHQRTPIFIGSRGEVERCIKYLF
jgi:sedoheptulose-bisphosphatase